MSRTALHCFTIHQLPFTSHIFYILDTPSGPAHAASRINRATARTPTLWSVVEHKMFQIFPNFRRHNSMTP